MCMDVNNRAPVKANPEELTGDIGRHWRLNQTKPDKFPSERVLNMIPLLFIYLHYYEYDKLVPNSFMQDRYKITSLKPKRSNAFHVLLQLQLYIVPRSVVIIQTLLCVTCLHLYFPAIRR